MSPLRVVPYSFVCLVLTLAPMARGEPAGPRSDSKPRTDLHGDPLPPGASVRLGNVRFRTGGAPIDLLQFSPDGQTVYSLDTSGHVRAWRADSGKGQLHCQLPGFSNWNLTADSRVLVAQMYQHDICMMATATGKAIREVTISPGHRLYPFCLAPNGKRLAAVATHRNTEDASFRIWSLPDGQELRGIPIAARQGEKADSIESVSFNADGKTLTARFFLTEHQEFAFRRWDAASGRELPATSHHHHSDHKPILSPDGLLLAISDKNNRKETSIRLVDVASGKTRRELAPPMTGRLFGMRFSSDGRKLLTVAQTPKGDSIRLWDVASGKALPPPQLDTITAEDVIFSPDGRMIATLEEDAIHLCETASGKHLFRMSLSYPFDEMRQTAYSPEKYLPERSSVAFSLDGKRLAVAPKGAALVQLWEVPSGKEIRSIPEGHDRAVSALAFAPDGKTVASLSSDGTLRLWEASTGRQFHLLPLAPTGPFTDLLSDCALPCMAFSPDGQTIASVNKLNIVQLWAVDTGKARLRFAVPKGGISDLLFSPDGKRLLMASQGRVLSWNARTGKAMGASMPAEVQRAGEEDTRLKLALSPDGRLLAALGERGIKHDRDYVQIHELRLWERATGKLRWRIPNEEDGRRFAKRDRWFSHYSHRFVRGTLQVAFASDGKTLIWNDGEALTLVDVVRGVSVRQFGSRLDMMSELAFSPRDDFLAIAHPAGVVRFVDPATGTLRGILDVPGKSLECIAFSPDGRTLATAGSDTTILLWDVDSIRQSWHPRKRPPATAEMDELWQHLGSEKGNAAAAAMAWLEAFPQQTVALLRQRLRPAVPLDADRAGRLLEDLASEDFKVRQRAAKELEKQGDVAEPFLRQRLAEKPSLEVRRRLESLLEALEGPPLRPEQMRMDRAVEVLEHLETAEARALLRELANGAPAARLTRESKGVLERLGRRQVTR